MRPFDYLSILVSIIVALGVTALLSNAARYIRLRDEIVGYAPAAIWSLALFLLLVQIWWVSFYRRDIESWTFFGFVLYLLIPILVALLSHLVLSDLVPGTNVEGEFLKIRTWFFGLLALAVVLSLVEDWVRSGLVHVDANFAFRCVFLVLAGAGLILKSRAGQLVVALAFLASLLAYISVVFPRL
jgi:hypothetical protein